MFSNIGPQEISYVLIRSQYGHRLWHDTHQDDFNSCPGIGKHSISNFSANLTILSRNSFRFALFHNKHCLLKPSQSEKSRGVKSGERGGQKCVLLVLFSDQETPCPERRCVTTGEVIRCTVSPGNFSHRYMTRSLHGKHLFS
jgi:hypothetical protein